MVNSTILGAYQILGLDSSSQPNLDKLREQYLLLAQQTHPDKNNNTPEAKELFQKVSGAYRTLKDFLTRTTPLGPPAATPPPPSARDLARAALGGIKKKQEADLELYWIEREREKEMRAQQAPEWKFEGTIPTDSFASFYQPLRDTDSLIRNGSLTEFHELRAEWDTNYQRAMRIIERRVATSDEHKLETIMNKIVSSKDRERLLQVYVGCPVDVTYASLAAVPCEYPLPLDKLCELAKVDINAGSAQQIVKSHAIVMASFPTLFGKGKVEQDFRTYLSVYTRVTGNAQEESSIKQLANLFCYLYRVTDPKERLPEREGLVADFTSILDYDLSCETIYIGTRVTFRLFRNPYKFLKIGDSAMLKTVLTDLVTLKDGGAHQNEITQAIRALEEIQHKHLKFHLRSPHDVNEVLSDIIGRAGKYLKNDLVPFIEELKNVSTTYEKMNHPFPIEELGTIITQGIERYARNPLLYEDAANVILGLKKLHRPETSYRPAFFDITVTTGAKSVLQLLNRVSTVKNSKEVLREGAQILGEFKESVYNRNARDKHIVHKPSENTSLNERHKKVYNYVMQLQRVGSGERRLSVEKIDGLMELLFSKDS